MPVTKSDLLSDDVGTRQNDRIPYRELPAFELVLFIIETMRIDTILAATAGWQRHRVIDEPTYGRVIVWNAYSKRINQLT